MTLRRILDIVLIVAALAVTLYVAALLLGGGENRRIPEVAEIEQQMVGTEFEGAMVEDADCPDQPFTEAGDSFECEVRLSDGSHRGVRVELINDDGWLTFELLGT